MHELAITRGILDIVLAHAERAGGGRVTDVHIVAGELSGVVNECIVFYWEIIARETPAEHAQLHFSRIPLEFECRACATVFAPTSPSFDCPRCGSDLVRVAAGEGVRVDSIDVEDLAAEPVAPDNRE